MAYDAKNAEKTEGLGLPKDTIFEGVIIHLEDGVCKNFLPEKAMDNWDGKLDNPAINVKVEFKVNPNDEDTITFHQMFTYNQGEGGKTLFSAGSNLGKYMEKYSKLPEVGDVVKIETTEKGYAKIRLS